MYFYLKQPNSNKETPIIIQYYVKSDPPNFKYSTGKKIHPKDWNFLTKLPISKKGAGGIKLKNISSKILEYNSFLEKSISNLEFNNEKITRLKLKELFDLEFKLTKNKVKKFNYFTDFVDDFLTQLPILLNRTTNRPYSKNVIKDYKNTLIKLKDFEKHQKTKIPINKFTINVYDQLTAYLINQKKYSRNYTGKIIKNLKIWLKEAELRNLPIHQDYKRPEFKKITEESISIALDEKEIEQIFNLNLTNHKSLQNSRDWIIIGCWTGLRVSDLLTLQNIDLSQSFITIIPKKTSLQTNPIKVVIPLHHHIIDIIKKRGMPKPTTPKTLNEHIKLICGEAKINTMVKGSKIDKSTNRKNVKIYKKYELTSTHTCRRSFATNLYKMNFPALSIMAITGHKTEASFLKYIKVTPTEHANKLLDHWEKYYKKPKSS